MGNLWHVTRNEPHGPQQFGPFSLDQLRELVGSGRVLPNDLVWQQGTASWVTVASLPFLASLVHPAAPAIGQAPLAGPVPPPPPTGSTTVRNLVFILGGSALLLTLGCGGLVLLGIMASWETANPRSPAPGPTYVPGAAPGTITFAEYVDTRTLATTNEGREFTTGVVWVLVRSNAPFHDTKLILTYRISGSNVSQVLGEHVVDPSWDTQASAVNLLDPGVYVVTATTGRGEVVAQDTVTVVPKY